MIKEYLASVETEFGLRHNLIKYTLSNNVEVILSDDELQELYEGSKLWSKIKILESENMKLEHQKEYFKGLILDFKSVINQMEKVRWGNL